MEPQISAYLSLRNESEATHAYISGLLEQFEKSIESESYHLALFAYHLLFMCFVYQTRHKMRRWLPDRFKDSIVHINNNQRKTILDGDKSIWAFCGVHESPTFEFLRLYDWDTEVVGLGKNLIEKRNTGYGHATGTLIDKDALETMILEYDSLAEKIYQLYQSELADVFAWWKVIADYPVSRNDIETMLVSREYLSTKDLIALDSWGAANLCSEHASQLNTILLSGYNIE